jgi:hypothetical protein
MPTPSDNSAKLHSTASPSHRKQSPETPAPLRLLKSRKKEPQVVETSRTANNFSKQMSLNSMEIELDHEEPSKQPPAGSAVVCPSRSPSRIQDMKKNTVLRASDVRRSKKKKKEPEDDELVQWVQCYLCDKWRKLPFHISSDTLPSIWRCSSITWSSVLADCSAPMERYDDTESEEENNSDLDMAATPSQKSPKVHSTASACNRKPPSRPSAKRLPKSRSVQLLRIQKIKQRAETSARMRPLSDDS